MREGIAEALHRISKNKAKKIRVQELAKFKDVFAMKVICDLAYNPNIEFLLPETDPPYKPADKESDVQNVLYRDVRKMIYFINSEQGKKLNKLKREQIFIEMLESVDPDDAKLILAVKNKKIPYWGMTKEVVAEAFPGIDNKW